MYKVIKDNKIIGVSEDIPSLLDEYEVIEDTEHTCKDYVQYNGEFLLKEDVPPPTYEEIDKAREDYRKEHIDSKTAMRSRKMANGTWTEEQEEEYLKLDEEVTRYIEVHFPYPVG